MKDPFYFERALEQAVHHELAGFPSAPVSPSARVLAALAATQSSISHPTIRNEDQTGIARRFKFLAVILVLGAAISYMAMKLVAPNVTPLPSMVRISPPPQSGVPVQHRTPIDTTQAPVIQKPQAMVTGAPRKTIGTWIQAPSSGFQPRYWFTTSEVDGKIYVIGGTSGVNLDTAVQVYDTKTGRWVTIQTTGTFTPRIALTSSVVNGKIYVIGGSRGPELPQNLSNALEVFDPATDAWSTPKTTGTFTPRCVLSSAVLNGKIYVIGGFDTRQDLSTFEVFDPKTNVWTTPITTGHFEPRGAFQAVVVNGKLYVVGGMQNGRMPTTVQVFDPVTNRWDSVHAIGHFAPRCDHACGVLDGKIYIMGGSTDGRTPLSKDAFQVFDPETRTWAVPKTRGRFTSRVYVSSVVVNNKFYVLGGIDSTGNLVNTNDEFEPPAIR